MTIPNPGSYEYSPRTRATACRSRPEAIGHGPAVKFGNELARIDIDVVDGADIAVVDLLVVIVLYLHDLVAGGECPAKPLHLTIAAAGFSAACSSMFNDRAPTPHHLDVADGIEAKTSRPGAR